MRILIAEDDSSIAETLRESLRREGHDATVVGNGALADTELQSRQYDLLILDLRLPDMPGMEVLARLRAREGQAGAARTAVLILTAQDDLRTKVGGLDAGADDYLGKPFELEELHARIRAIARNRGGAALQFGELSFDPIGRSAKLNGAPLELSAREADLLEALIRRPGRLVSKAALTGHLAGSEDEAASALELYVQRFAKKLQGSNLRLVSVPGLGCSLEKR
ncbi:MAG: response regulator transcription factor [Burkholderiales bacterium]